MHEVLLPLSAHMKRANSINIVTYCVIICGVALCWRSQSRCGNAFEGFVVTKKIFCFECICIDVNLVLFIFHR